MGIPERLDHRLRPIVVLGLVAMIALAACAGSTSAPYPAGADENGGAQSAPGEAPAAANDEDNQGQRSSNDTSGNPPGAPRDDLKVVYTGSLQLVVADLQQALARGRAAVAAVGGYIGASEESNADDRAVATITYRIPATRWEAVIADLRGLATKVVFEQTQATEVGNQIVDLEARLRNLRASEAALVEIAKGTGKISDLLLVEEQLTQVRGQVEQLDAQRAQLEDQVSYGTLVTTYGTEIVAVQETAKGWDPADDVDGALATLIGMGQAIVSTGIWFAIVWLPLLLVLLVILLVIRFGFRRLAPKPRRRRRGPGGPVQRTSASAPRASHAATAWRARSRDRFQAGHPRRSGLSRRSAARPWRNRDSQARSAASGSRSIAATTAGTAS